MKNDGFCPASDARRDHDALLGSIHIFIVVSNVRDF